MSHLGGLMALARPFEAYVHPRAAADPVTCALHRNFIGARLVAGAVAIAAFAVYLGLNTAVDRGVVGIFALLIAPVLSAIFLSRTGSLARATMLSAVLFAGLVYVTAAETGGIASPFVVWMLVVPLEAALARDRRVVAGAAAVSVATLSALVAAPGADVAAVEALYARAPMLALAVAVSVILYAAMTVVLMWSRETELQTVFETDAMRHRLLAENATDVVSRHDAAGRARHVSTAASRLLGLPGEALLGERWLDRVHPADRPGFADGIRQTIRRGEPVSFEFRMRRARTVSAEWADYARDDEYVWVEMRCRPTRPDEALDGDLVAVTRDIQARKEQEAVLESARAEAERANRAKTRFLANVSHELRTPLNAIIGFSELLRSEVHGPVGHPRNGEYVALINESGNHLLQLVNEILDMSKIESGRFAIFAEPFDVKMLLNSSAAMMSGEVQRKNLALTVDVADDRPEFNADRRACRQMLLNLLSNAVKFTPEGGRIDLAAEFRPTGLALIVADTGVGIAPEDISRLGRPFVQADSSYNRSQEGTGLGLSIVRGLAELHGGTMRIDSKPGLGTKVTVFLPTREEAAAARPKRANSGHRDAPVERAAANA